MNKPPLEKPPAMPPQGKRQLIGLLRPDASRAEIQAFCDRLNAINDADIAREKAEKEGK